MSDILDSTDAIEQRILDQRLAAIRDQANTRQYQPKGECIWCGERFSQGSQNIFCDVDCAGDHEKYHRK